MGYVARSDWGARYGIGLPVPSPQSGVVFHHDPLRHTHAQTTEAQERSIMQIIERHAATSPNLTGGGPHPRISYHWAFAHSGRVYEGLGWGRIGAHVANANTPNLGLFFMLDGRTHEGSPAMWRSVSEVIREGIRIGALIERPRLFSHRDLVNTSCPGDALNRKVKSFTLDSLLGLSEPMLLAPPPGTRVWSNHFGEHLIVIRYRSDTDWEFIPESILTRLRDTMKAQTPFSRMPGPKV